jgi:hypothetical protein
LTSAQTIDGFLRVYQQAKRAQNLTESEQKKKKKKTLAIRTHRLGSAFSASKRCTSDAKARASAAGIDSGAARASASHSWRVHLMKRIYKI